MQFSLAMVGTLVYAFIVVGRVGFNPDDSTAVRIMSKILCSS